MDVVDAFNTGLFLVRAIGKIELSWNSEIGSIKLTPKIFKITQTQNQKTPTVLIDRYSSYKHFAPLATQNGPVDREKSRLQILLILVKFLNVLL